jgi:quinol monooxygenase YgiN
MQLSRRAVMGAALGAAAAGTRAPGVEPAERVIELRQYKIVHGKRDALIDLFEREFVDSQEKLGIRLIGQYRDLDDPDRFTWVREFPSMAARAVALKAFYFGPDWQAHRAEANPMLDDNDNVLLLRPAAAGTGFGQAERHDEPGASGIMVATIHYLWKEPTEGFAAFFQTRMRPLLEAAGLPVIAAFVPERTPNNFPSLPIREGEKLFLWFTRAAGTEAHALARLSQSSEWRTSVAPLLDDFEERPAQQLRLQPTPRSRFR